ncbi:hypothetical protein HK405_015424 [Cladochytrium tenue]|nr:hypothetical protein HK405_015424 [Cladochytrium tenue]
MAMTMATTTTSTITTTSTTSTISIAVEGKVAANDLHSNDTAVNEVDPPDDMEDIDDDSPEAKVARVGETVKVTKDGGVMKKVLKDGEDWERPADGDEIRVIYIGRLREAGVEPMNGAEFDRNEDKSRPFTFTLGKGQVIKGWDKVVPTMKKGERALVTIKPEYGYGDTGAGDKIPPKATLEFEVELLDWRNVNALTTDGKVVLKFIKQSPGGWQQPKDGWELTSLKKFKKDSANAGDIAVLTVGPPHHPRVQGFPEDVTVQYEIFTLRWTEVEELEGSTDRAAVKKVLQEGDGWEKPKDGSTVRIKIEAKTQQSGRCFIGPEESEVVLGQSDLPEAVEAALLTMKMGENALLTANGDWGYGSTATAAKGLDDVVLEGFVCQLELLDLKKAKESYDLTKDEKIADSQMQKELGNQFFKDGKTRMAIRKYEKVIQYFQYEQNLSPDEKAKVNAIKLPCHLNLAACYLKVGQDPKVIEEATKALEISPHSVKALFRRAQAYLKQLDLDLARRDVDKAMEVDPNDASLARLQLQIRAEQKRVDERDKRMFQKMFR